MDALVSVAMATYNGARFLREQMDSILSQTYKNIEVVACDDCSTDSTWEILQAYAARDGRVRCFQNGQNLGFKKNFERAISLCEGEFIALSDQDDIWLAKKLEALLRAISRGSGDLVCSASQLIDESGKPLYKRLMFRKRIPKDKDKQLAILCTGNFVQGATVLAKASFIKQCLPIPDSCKYHDWWFALCAALQNGILHTPKPLVLYRRHQDQVTWENVDPCVDREARLRERMKEIRGNLKAVQGVFSLSEKALRIVRDAAEFNESLKGRGWLYLAYCFRHCGMRRTVQFFLKALFSRAKRTAKAALGLEP